MARRLAALLLMEPALDANFFAIKESTFDWQSLKIAMEDAHESRR